LRNPFLAESHPGRSSRVSIASRAAIGARDPEPHESPAMDAEQLNQIAATLADLDARLNELRRYL